MPQQSINATPAGQQAQAAPKQSQQSAQQPAAPDQNTDPLGACISRSVAVRESTPSPSSSHIVQHFCAKLGDQAWQALAASHIAGKPMSTSELSRQAGLPEDYLGEATPLAMSAMIGKAHKASGLNASDFELFKAQTANTLAGKEALSSLVCGQP